MLLIVTCGKTAATSDEGVAFRLERLIEPFFSRYCDVAMALSCLLVGDLNDGRI
jgi:hypothetical protein